MISGFGFSMIVIGIVVSAFTMVGFAVWHIEWSTDRKMTVKNCSKWDYVNFGTFLKIFNTVLWDDDWSNNHFEGSLFSKSSDSQIHAGIIKIRGKGMVIKFWQYPKFMKFKKTMNQNLIERRAKGLWEKPELKVVK